MTAYAVSDPELVAAIQALNDALTGKQDVSSAATDAELAAAVVSLNDAISLKQDASGAATDAELAAAVANLNAAVGLKQDANTAATDAELTAGLAGKVSSTDPRLADTRTPTDGTVTPAKASASFRDAYGKREGRSGGQLAVPGNVGWFANNATFTTAGLWGRPMGVRFVADRNFTATKMAFFLQAAGADDDVQMALFNADGTSRLGQTAVTQGLLNLGTNGFKNVNLQQPVDLVAGTTYNAVFFTTGAAGHNATIMWCWANANGAFRGFGDNLGQIDSWYGGTMGAMPAAIGATTPGVAPYMAVRE